MSEAIAKLMNSRPDTPPASMYQEYDKRKAELWLKYGPGDEYDMALRELIDELEI